MAVSGLWTGDAQGQPASSAPRALPQEQFICRLPGATDRRIGIYRPGGPRSPRRCRVDYTRNGRTRSLWSSGHGYEFCIRKALEIVALLQSVNFECIPQTTQASGSAPVP